MGNIEIERIFLRLTISILEIGRDSHHIEDWWGFSKEDSQLH